MNLMEMSSINQENQNDDQPHPTALLTVASTGNDQIPVHEIYQMPWKYLGYKEYSKFIASDDELFLLRRFRTLNVRIALALQDNLSKLESQLAEIDRHCSQREAVPINNGSFREETQESRKVLLNDIQQKLKEYSKTSSKLSG
jgi:hypothetical protein